MLDTIEISNEDAPLMLEFLQKKQEEDRLDVQKKMEAMRKREVVIEKLKTISISDSALNKQTTLFKEIPIQENKLEQYDKEWRLPKKVKYAFTTKGKVMTARQALSQIFVFEPTLEGDNKKNNSIATQIASYVLTNTKVKDEDRKIYRRVVGSDNGEVKIGLKEWFDINGVIKEEYK